MARSRSRIFACLSILLLGIELAPDLRAQQLALDFDANHTRVEFTLGASLHTVHGTFVLKHGSIRLDPTTNAATGQIVVDAASGDSGSEARDRRMNREILESDKFPEIIFTADKFEGQIPASGDFLLKVHGIFRLHGADHEMTLA
ncbi:MAG: YceI family protein, partial [Candidatus Acidiferrales bacterium]